MPINSQPNRAVDTAKGTEKTDSQMVLSLLNDLGTKMQTVDEKVEQIQLDEKKYYESLRRGLKRLKEDKLTGYTSAPPDEKGDYPCCICNYCLKRIDPIPPVLMVSERGYICDVRNL